MLLKKLAVQNQLDFQCMKFRLTTKMAFWYPPLFPADFPHNVFIGHISELSCFLYLMQIFGTLVEKKNEGNVVEKASGTKPTRFPMHEIPTDN